MKIIGIAGGSGTGKSTVAWALVDSNPGRFQVLNFDDYQKVITTPGLPQKAGMINWDHPDIIRWDDLIADVQKLRAGKSLKIASKDRRLNPDYDSHHRRVGRIVEPRPILLVEGYLALHDPRLNGLYDQTFYLDLHEAGRHERRDKHTGPAEEYKTHVLRPMHDRYVEPTKARADAVIDITGMGVEEIRDRITRELS